LSEELDSARQQVAELEAGVATLAAEQAGASEKLVELEHLREDVAKQQRTNVALKRGVDSLRHVKTTADQRIEAFEGRVAELEAELEAELASAVKDELKERVVDGESRMARLQVELQEQTAAADSLRKALDRQQAEGLDAMQRLAGTEQQHGQLQAALSARDEKIGSLESNAAAQIELIESLQADLRDLQVAKRDFGQKEQEFSAYEAERDAKDKLIESLEADVEELSRVRARLREKDAEAARLRGALDTNLTLIESLQKETAELRQNHGAPQSAAGQTGDDAYDDLAVKLKEKETAIAILSRAVRKRDLQVATLSRDMDELNKRYSTLETQYVGSNPTMPSLRALSDKEMGRVEE